MTPDVSPEPAPVPGRPVLRIIRGDATPEEVAALRETNVTPAGNCSTRTTSGSSAGPWFVTVSV